MYAANLQSTHERDAATWRNMVIIEGPEARDDPKMSSMIVVSYSPMILFALCHAVRGHSTIFLYPSSLLFLPVSTNLQTDTQL